MSDLDLAAKRVSDAHDRAAHLFAEITREPMVMAAIQKIDSDLHRAIEEAMAEWTDAGNAGLAAAHQAARGDQVIKFEVEVTLDAVKVAWPSSASRVADRLAEEIGVAVVMKLGPKDGWRLGGASFNGPQGNEQRWERVWETQPRAPAESAK